LKITGQKKLMREMIELPKDARTNIRKVIKRNAEAGARMARTLVPVDSGELKGWIHTKYSQDGMGASIEAAPFPKESQIKAKAVEFGRTKGDRGTTNPSPYMRIMQSHLGKRFKNSIKNAIKKAAKEAFK